MKNFLRPLSIAAFLTLAGTVNAQITMPSPSTTASVKQPVGMTEITLDYSRPSAKGRKIMGEIAPVRHIAPKGTISPMILRPFALGRL